MKVLRHTTADQLRQGDVVSFDRSFSHVRWNVTSVDRSVVSPTLQYVFVCLDGDEGHQRATVISTEPVTIWEAE